MKKVALFFIILFLTINASFSNEKLNLTDEISFEMIIDSVDNWYRKDHLSINTNRNSLLLGEDCLTKLKQGILFYKTSNIELATSIFKSIIENTKATDECKVVSYWNLGKICIDSIQYGDYSFYYLKADSLVQRTLSVKEQTLYYTFLIKDYNEVTIHNLPFKVINNAVETFILNEDWQNAALFMHKKTAYYRNIGNYYQALKCQNETLQFCREHNLEEFEGKVLLWSYEIYEYLGDTIRILRDINRAMFLNKKFNDSDYIARSNNTLGRYYSFIKNYNQAAIHYKKAALLNEKLHNKYRLAINYLNLGEANLFLNNLKEAEKYYIKSIDLNNIVGFDIGNGFAFAGLLDLYLKEGDTKKALYYADSAKFYAEKANYHRVETYLYSVLINLYKQIEEKDSCIIYLSKLRELERNISSKEILSKMQMYETNIKEKEIALLQSEQNLLKSREEKSRQKLIWLIAIIILVVAALLIIMALFFLKEKAYSKLVEKNMELIKVTENSYKSSKSNHLNQEITNEDHVLAQKFISLLNEDVQCRNPEISMDYFADLLNTNRAYLSKAINKTFKKNFSMIINEHRIQEACKMLVDSKYNYLSIEGIASTVGFNSKTSFNRTFKLQTGLIPSDFRNNQT